jgi:hypothetical protein
MGEVGDPTRTGPNQDINDPTRIDDLRDAADSAAVMVGDTDPDGGPSPAITIQTPIRKEDGTTETYDRTDPISYETWIETVINTYINLPERFRDYYSQMKDIIDGWAGSTSDVDYYFEGYGLIDLETWSPTSCLLTHKPTWYTIYFTMNGTYKNWRYTSAYTKPSPNTWTNIKASLSWDIDPPEVSIPEWSGNGPTNYNYGTFPQLITAFSDLEDTIDGWTRGTVQMGSGHREHRTYEAGEHKTGVSTVPPSVPSGQWPLQFPHSPSGCGRTWGHEPYGRSTLYDWSSMYHGGDLEIGWTAPTWTIINDTSEEQTLTFKVEVDVTAGGSPGAPPTLTDPTEEYAGGQGGINCYTSFYPLGGWWSDGINSRWLSIISYWGGSAFQRYSENGLTVWENPYGGDPFTISANISLEKTLTLSPASQWPRPYPTGVNLGIIGSSSQFATVVLRPYAPPWTTICQQNYLHGNANSFTVTITINGKSMSHSFSPWGS